MIRTFLAIELTDELKNEMTRLINGLKSLSADVKWVRPQGVHLTLKFLGSTDEALIDPLGESAAKAMARFKRPCLSLDKTGVFPNRSRPKVAWIGLKGDLSLLSKIHTALDKAVEAFGFEPEKRRFSPHITLGRIRTGKNRNRLMDTLEALDPKPVYFEADAVYLIKSDLKPSGAQYTKLARFSFEQKNMEEQL